MSETETTVATISEMQLIAHLGYDRPRRSGEIPPTLKCMKQRCATWRRPYEMVGKLKKLPLNNYLISEVEALTGRPVLKHATE